MNTYRKERVRKPNTDWFVYFRPLTKRVFLVCVFRIAFIPFLPFVIRKSEHESKTIYVI
jgi:hypothetical protein